MNIPNKKIVYFGYQVWEMGAPVSEVYDFLKTARKRKTMLEKTYGYSYYLRKIIIVSIK